MSIAQTLEDEIRRLYGELGTQQSVADALGVTRQFIQQIISGKAKCGNITAFMIDKMFPNAQIELGSGGIVNTGSIVNAPQTIHNHAAPPSSEVIKGAMYDLLARIMASDEIDASAKVILYNAINDFLNNAQK